MTNDVPSRRVGNIGSLSWFATVYLETHLSFTAAYGLTLGFMLIALCMLIVGRHHYGTSSTQCNLPICLTELLQSKLQTSRTPCPKRSGSLPAPAGTGSGWHTRDPLTNLSTALGLCPGVVSW